VRGILVCLALSGCVAKHSPQPNDTKLNEDKRDWVAVYHEELRIAFENEDFEARYFFLQEIIKMKYKAEHNQDLPANPRLQILK
tara:strand:- start:1577 stop:1828 length:252 start_codon:yes stop_codon:yes gene_type:complete